MTEGIRDCLLHVMARICLSQSKMTSLLASSMEVLPDRLRETLKRDTLELEQLLNVIASNGVAPVHMRDGDVVRLIADQDVSLLFEGTIGDGREWLVTGKRKRAG